MFRRQAYTGAELPKDTKVPRMPSNVQPAPAPGPVSLLDWMTPLGKRLGDCTGDEIAALAALFNELAKSKSTA